MQQIPHETDEQLELYALGRLPENQAAAVEEHLLICAQCQKRLDEVEAFAFAMRDAMAKESELAGALPLGGFAAMRMRWFRQPVVIWAGAVTILVIAVGLYLGLENKAVIAPVAELQLSAMRGETPSVVPAKETVFTLSDAPSGVLLHVEAVDINGGVVWTGTLPGTVPATLRLSKQLTPGDYFLRLYDGTGKLLHEYVFRVRTPL